MVVDPVNQYQKLQLQLYELLRCQHPKHVELPTEM